MDNEFYMQKAIEVAKEGIQLGQTPFGAVIVKDDKIIACEHNRVWKNTDSSAHAEVQAIRAACKNINSIDLSGATIYTTTEPCPMCFAAIHWAKISTIVFGAYIKDAQAAGFNELTISNELMKSHGNSPVEIIPGIMNKQCAELFNLWKNSPKAKVY